MLRFLKQYYPIQNVIFQIGEGIIIFFSIVISTYLFIDKEIKIYNNFYFLKVFLITFIFQYFFYYFDLYDFKQTKNFWSWFSRLCSALGLSTIVLAIIYIIYPDTIISEWLFEKCIVFIIIFIFSWRILYQFILITGVFNQRIILLGTGDLARELLCHINEKKDCGYEVFMDFTDKSHNQKNLYEDLFKIVEENKIKKIVVALHEKRGAMPVKQLIKCRVAGIEIIDGMSFYEMLNGKLIVKYLNPSWIIFSEGFKKNRFQKFLKRVTDIFFSVLILSLTLPVTLLTAVLIKIESPGPVIFSQERVGKKKKKFYVYKFRSMCSDAEKNGPVWAKKNDNRITRVGKFIRKCRIDEIPQLLNVLKGEMSFVGPRPEREHFVDILEGKIPYYRQRFTVRPGLTGWAQICFGYTDDEEGAMAKLDYEFFYIKNLSVLFDIVIIFRTIKTVLSGSGSQ